MDIEVCGDLIKELGCLMKSNINFTAIMKDIFKLGVGKRTDLTPEVIEKYLTEKSTNKDKLEQCIRTLRIKEVPILDKYLYLLYYFVIDSRIMRNSVDAKIHEVKSRIHQIHQESTTRPPENRSIEGKHNVTWDFVNGPEANFDFVYIEGRANLEKYLVEDLLSLFIGCHGILIKANPIKDENDMRTFRISPQVTPSMQGLINRMLPLASYYSTITRFVEKNEELCAGRVNQALAAKLTEELEQYMDTILEIENSHRIDFIDLNLMWTELLDTMHRMKVLAEITNEILKTKSRGGETLSILHSNTVNCLSDPEVQSMCFSLTQVAAQPYLNSVSSWIFFGKIYDPFQEFMISEKPDGQEDPLSVTSWIRKFTVRQEYIPLFLQNVSLEIINGGKFIDIIRRSMNLKPDVAYIPIESLVYDIIDLNYIDVIKRAHNTAESALLKMLINDCDIIGRLSTAKSFFSIEYGDFFYNIIDNCLEELERPSGEVCVTYLLTLVKTSIEMSSVSILPYSTEFNMHLEKGTLKWQISNLGIKDRKPTDFQTGLEAITLKMKSDWPVSLLFGVNSVKCYQMLFRHFFYLKYIYMKLTSITNENMSLSCCAIKHSMSVFVQSCISYMSVEAVQAVWNKFEQNFKRMTGIAELVESHDRYIYDVLNGCMLTSADVYERLRDVLEICNQFAEKPKYSYRKIFEQSLQHFITKCSNESSWICFNLQLIHTFSFIPEIKALQPNSILSEESLISNK